MTITTGIRRGALGLALMIAQGAHAGTITFTDVNDVATVTSITGFGTAATGIITSNVCASSSGTIAGSGFQCIVGISAPTGGSSPSGGPFRTNFYGATTAAGIGVPANLEATLIFGCSDAGCLATFTTESDLADGITIPYMAPLAGALNVYCPTAPAATCFTAGNTPFGMTPFSGNSWVGSTQIYNVGLILPDDIAAASTPEPATFLVAGTALAGLGLMRKRMAKRTAVSSVSAG